MDKKHRLIRLWLLVFVCAAVALAADPTGTIAGTVTDPSGAAVANADVTVRNTNTGLTRTAKTDAQGGFLFPLMPVGSYDVSVEMQGFRRFEQTGITLLVNGVANIPVALQLGQVTESVTVEANAAMVETRSGTIKGVVDQQRIVELPLNGRNAATLINLVAGTVDTLAGNANGSGDAIQGGTYPGAQAVSANGARSDGVNYLLDGGSNRDPYTNVNDPFPNPDALQEFVVQTNNYGAEFGRASGAIVSVVTKSGTNELHGSAFEFLRNEDLNARNFFSPSADILKRNQFGGSLGGPIAKDKLFYFGTIQGTTLRSLPASSNALVPTAAERNGDFSAIKRQLKNPSTGQPFPNNQIPTSLFVPAATKLLDSIPVPDNSQGLIFFTRPNIQHEVQFMGRVDYNTERNRLYGRYFISDLPIQPTAIKTNLVAAAGGKAFRSQNVSGTDTYTFSPTLINNAQFTFSRTHAGVVSAAPFAWSDLGIPIAHTTPSELALSVSGFFSISSGHPGLFARQSYNFSDSVHWIRGGHELAMGFDYLKMNIDLINTFRQNGNFRFRGTGFTGNALSDFFLGYADRFIQGGGEYAERRGTLASGFIQDNWKINRQLTVNIGLRYDPFVPFSDERGFTDCFRPGLKSTRFVNAPVNYIYAGDSGCPAGGTGSRWLQFAPRFGFSYDVTGKGKTVVRGGYGLFYQPPFVESFNNMVDSAPFSPQFIRFSVPFMDPFRGTQNPFPAQYGPQEPPKNVAFELPVTAVSYSADWKPAQVQSWNIAVEHQVRADLLARVAYVGSKGTHLGYNTDLNAPPFGPGASADNIDDRRPYQNFATVIEDEAGATSIYNSLQATLEKRFSKNFSVLANYTWAKSIDTASFQTDLCGINIIDPFNIGLYRGPSDYDSKHRMVLSYLWQMPGFKNSSPLVRHALGGWESSGIWNWQSGFPLTITSADERSLTGIGNDNADYVGGTTALSPDRARGQLIQQYFNTSAFDLAKLGTFGSSGRGVLRGPGTFNIDFSAMKNFVVRERFRIQYRAEFFNLFNTPQFDNPDTGVADSRFGQITGARAPRIIQMALKMYW